MATYTITINERTNSGKLLLAYLVELGLINEKKEPNETTKKAVKEAEEGKLIKCASIDNFKKQMHAL